MVYSLKIYYASYLYHLYHLYHFSAFISIISYTSTHYNSMYKYSPE